MSVAAPMNRLFRFLLAGVVGVIFGEVVYPHFVQFVLESAGADDRVHALVAGAVVLAGVVFGILARMRVLRMPGRPSRLPWISRWAFVQLGVGIILLGACSYLSRTSSTEVDWTGPAASFGAWLSVGAGAVVCAALSLATGLWIVRERSVERRWPALVAPCAFFAVAQVATTALASFDQVIEEARTESGISIDAVPASISSPNTSPIACANSFVLPNGSRHQAFQTNKRTVERRARWHVDGEQLLFDAVFFTCRSPREEPERYFTVVVRNLLIREGRWPHGEVCSLDPQMPEQPNDLDLQIQTARCWNLVQLEACKQGTEFVALLHLLASGAKFPEIAESLGGTAGRAKMQWLRFRRALPEKVLEQCR